jgi:hypothetical protein
MGPIRPDDSLNTIWLALLKVKLGRICPPLRQANRPTLIVRYCIEITHGPATLVLSIINASIPTAVQGGQTVVKFCASMLLAGLFLASPIAPGQDRPKPTTLIELLANPEKFDGVTVTVRGYFVSNDPKHDISAYFLYLNREDAENLLGDAVVVVPTEQMRRDKEKLDRMFVMLTGRFRAVPTADKSFATALKDIVSCTVWSDPNRPIGLKGYPKMQ